MSEELPTPASRTESYLAKAAGEDVTIPEKPESRIEQYLEAIAENGGGGGGGGTSNFNQLTNRPKYNGVTMTGSTNIPQVKTYTAGSGVDITGNAISVDTTTIQPKLTAGSNISIADNTISATDTTYSAFTGTDGTAAGTAGLVPAPATADAGKFLKADGTWATAGGGSGPTVVQTTGTSTTDVMSQNATTSMVFADPSIQRKVQIGDSANASGTNSVAIGYRTVASQNYGVVIGDEAQVGSSHGVAIGFKASAQQNSVAIGRNATTTRNGEMNIGTGSHNNGYNNTPYRVIGGVYDGQDAHDATTVGQVNTRLGGLTLLPITQTAYDALATKDANTLYVITGA